MRGAASGAERTRSSATSDARGEPRRPLLGTPQPRLHRLRHHAPRAAEHENANLEKIRVQAQVAADVVAAYETRQAASRQIEEARETVIEAVDSLKLNFLNIRQGANCPEPLAPSKSSSRSRPWPRPESITLTRCSPTTAPSSASSGPSASHREGRGRDLQKPEFKIESSK